MGLAKNTRSPPHTKGMPKSLVSHLARWGFRPHPPAQPGLGGFLPLERVHLLLPPPPTWPSPTFCSHLGTICCHLFWPVPYEHWMGFALAGLREVGGLF